MSTAADSSDGRASTVGKFVGTIAVIAGFIGGLALIWTAVLPHVVFSGAPRFAADIGAANAPTIAFWALLLLAVSGFCGYAIGTNRVLTLWVLGAVGTIFGALALFSIGLYVLPFGVLTLIAAVLLTVGRRGSDVGPTPS